MHPRCMICMPGLGDRWTSRKSRDALMLRLTHGMGRHDVEKTYIDVYMSKASVFVDIFYYVHLIIIY